MAFVTPFLLNISSIFPTQATSRCASLIYSNIVLENGAHYAQDAHLTLEEMVTIAKDKGLDPIAFLKEKIVIEEVDVQ